MNRKKVNWSKAGKKAWATRRKNAAKKVVPPTKKTAKTGDWRKKVNWSKAGRKAWKTRRARYYTIL